MIKSQQKHATAAHQGGPPFNQDPQGIHSANSVIQNLDLNVSHMNINVLILPLSRPAFDYQD